MPFGQRRDTMKSWQFSAFLKNLTASSSVFGVCANEWSPSDGQVVSLDHGCGAHSETDVEARAEQVDTPVLDEIGDVEIVRDDVVPDAPADVDIPADVEMPAEAEMSADVEIPAEAEDPPRT